MANETIESEIDLTREQQGARQQQVQRQEQQKFVADDGSELPEVEIVDDTPEQDRNRSVRRDTGTSIPGDDEVEKYSKNVQDRFKQMKWEYHEERRSKEKWEREHAAAIDLAQRVYRENQQLRKTLEEGHKTMLASNKSSADSEITALKSSLTAAMEAGNSAQVAELQEQIAKAAARSVNLEQIQPLRFEEAQGAGQVQQQDQRQAQQVQLTGSMRQWMMRNPWFNGTDEGDRKMTSYAFGVHDELVAEGIKPESPAYFKAVDAEMRRVFPDTFGIDNRTNGNGSSSQSRSRTVAGATRFGSGGPGDRSQRNRDKVALTLSEVAVAKRVGITPEQYAREKQRLAQQEN